MYDSQNKIPLWTSERISKESLTKKANRKLIRFEKDNEIYPGHRSHLQDYSRSSFDMIPAGDQQHSEKALKDTFHTLCSC